MPCAMCPHSSAAAAQVLASVPDLDMLAHLPRFLERLLDCLRDPLGEVRAQAAKVLQARPIFTRLSYGGAMCAGALHPVLACLPPFVRQNNMHLASHHALTATHIAGRLAQTASGVRCVAVGCDTALR